MDTNDKNKLILKELQELRKDVKIIDRHMTDLKITAAVNSKSLEEHMRRTDGVEAQIKEQRNFKWYFAGLAIFIGAALEFIRGIN